MPVMFVAPTLASLALALAASASPAVHAAPRPELATVVDQVQKRYDGAADFRARFNQTLTNAALKRKSTSSGEVLLKKPGRMRWNYQTPEPKMYLSDGDTLWLYEPEDKQAFKQDLKSTQLPAALAFLTGKGKLKDEFEITWSTDTRFAGPGDYVLSLSPKQPQSQVKSLLFVVDPETSLVRQTVLIDPQGNTNDILFSDIQINTKIPDATFRWSPPKGVRLIDAAKLGR